MPDYSKAIWSPSPNFWHGRRGFSVQYIVMHGTDGDMPGCLNWLDSPQSQASVQYLVDRGGTVYQLVAEADSAWGNGIPEPSSQFYGGPNPNFFTISIEHERDNGNTSPITPAQLAASTALVADIRRRYGNLPLIPHSEISPQSRAACPGPGFPMAEIDAGSTPTPAPSFKNYVLDVAMHVRSAPDAGSTQGRLLPVGTKVVEMTPPDSGPVERNGWAYCRTGGDVAQGWLLISNMHTYTP